MILRALLIALLASLVGGGLQTWRLHSLQAEVAREQAAKVAAALAYSENARKAEADSAQRMKEIQDAKDANLRRVRGALDAALGELRQRPERAVPGAAPEARAACAGATGAELSGRDAEFLARLAARADELRSELGACQQRELAGPVSVREIPPDSPR